MALARRLVAAVDTHVHQAHHVGRHRVARLVRLPARRRDVEDREAQLGQRVDELVDPRRHPARHVGIRALEDQADVGGRGRRPGHAAHHARSLVGAAGGHRVPRDRPHVAPAALREEDLREQQVRLGGRRGGAGLHRERLRLRHLGPAPAAPGPAPRPARPTPAGARAPPGTRPPPRRASGGPSPPPAAGSPGRPRTRRPPPSRRSADSGSSCSCSLRRADARHEPLLDPLQRARGRDLRVAIVGAAAPRAADPPRRRRRAWRGARRPSAGCAGRRRGSDPPPAAPRPAPAASRSTRSTGSGACPGPGRPAISECAPAYRPDGAAPRAPEGDRAEPDQAERRAARARATRRGSALVAPSVAQARGRRATRRPRGRAARAATTGAPASATASATGLREPAPASPAITRSPRRAAPAPRARGSRTRDPASSSA